MRCRRGTRTGARIAGLPHVWMLGLVLAHALSYDLRAESPFPAIPPGEAAVANPQGPTRPEVLRSPEEAPLGVESATPQDIQFEPLFRTPVDPPLGFTSHSSVLPRETQTSSDFVPVEDRWRIGFPEWDRYGEGHPPVTDYPYQEGQLVDPYNQNVLKGDYAIFGQHTFLNFTASTDAVFETRQVPTPASENNGAGQPGFFGNPNQFFYTQYFLLSVNLLHGDAAFKPADWQVRITPVFNTNYLVAEEVGVVNADVTRGTTRLSGAFALQEWFAEFKLADLSPNYDFLSLRGGAQYFNSDFRGFIFNDTNRAIRLFGTRLDNRDQFNLIVFDETDKETNSELNTFNDRHEQTLIANYYRQDFIWPGYTVEASFHYDHDSPSMHFDSNGFLVRPAPIGIAMPHEINAFYLGLAGDGHIGPINVNDAFYWVLGRDDLNPLTGTPVNINAQMAAVELSYRPRLGPFPHLLLLRFWRGKHQGQGSPRLRRDLR